MLYLKVAISTQKNKNIHLTEDYWKIVPYQFVIE
jgi:sulfur relay (sulfurtransferase) DsrC/TusE family protein